MSTYKGWRSVLGITLLVGGIATAVYPIIIAPYFNPQPWKEEQQLGRMAYPDREKIQPGGMKTWSDPFGRK